MRNQTNKKFVRILLLLILAGLLSLILWLTLFSRLGSDSRNFYPPFWSYRAILNGSTEALFEDVGNIILFIPIGVVLALLLGLRTRTALIVGFSFSLLIECCQWFFWLGSFEIDDLIHNIIGAGIGAEIINRITFRKILTPESRKKSLASLLILTLIIVSLGFVYKGVKWQTRERLAAMNDREDGTTNLLVLNGKEGYVGESEVYVSYRKDGGINISGLSDKVGYLLIGNPSLEPGSYTLTGFSGADPNTVGIYLEKKKEGNYLRFTPDLGPVDSVSFKLAETAKIKAYIKIYPGAEVNFIAYPVIYREE